MASKFEIQEVQAHERLVQLVVKKCTIKRNIQIYIVETLLDRVCILDRQWMKIYLRDDGIRPLGELTGLTSFELIGISGEPFPYDGLVKVMVSLPGNSKVPPNFNTSNSLVLFEPHVGNTQLQ